MKHGIQTHALLRKAGIACYIWKLCRMKRTRRLGGNLFMEHRNSSPPLRDESGAR